MVGCPTGSASTCGRDNYSLFLLQMQFFRNALTGPDQLRQRVAFALSQIMVVSGIEINQPYGMADYQNLLLKDAFGNYRQLLEDVTLSPVMGHYLDMASNDKPNPSKGINPNENYAREINQLFSIGLVQLNADGSSKLDGNGQPIATYDQSVVEGFSSVFTGWTYPPVGSAAAKFPDPLNYDGQMVAIPEHHDPGAKTLLNGSVLPAGPNPATAPSQAADLKQALDNIFNHPNVGPFIGKQLIQQLVTSNPSPAYVSRITATFNDNGHGVRGDLQAVVRAILLDAEARGDANSDINFGKLREPVLLLASVLRGIGGATQSDGEYLRGASAAMSQNVFQAGSVFNYYPPSYPLHGTTLVAPPFGIYDPTTAVNRSNTVLRLLGPAIAADGSVAGATGTSLDLSAWQTAAADNATLIGKINQQFFHGAMSPTLQNTLAQNLNNIPVSDPADRARSALYLALASPEYQVEH